MLRAVCTTHTRTHARTGIHGIPTAGHAACRCSCTQLNATDVGAEAAAMNVAADDTAAAADSETQRRLLASMQRRAEQVAERSQRRKHETPGGKTEAETADAFSATFSEMRLKLEADLRETEGVKGDKEELMEHLNTLVKNHAAMQSFLSESSLFLPPFQKKTSQDTLAELDLKIRAQMDAFQPKKRFGFKSRGAKPAEKTAKPVGKSEDTSSKQTSNSFLDNLMKQNFFGFQDKSNETLIMEPSEMLDRQLNLQNLTNCTVKVLGNPGAIQASNLTNCKVLIGPTSRSAFIKQSENCEFVLACQQVRIHDTEDTKFYLHVTGSAIIESCKNVGFAPYNLEYSGLDEHYKSSGLDRGVNKWDDVQDFKWISENEKSPNMYIIEESLRKTDWLGE